MSTKYVHEKSRGRGVFLVVLFPAVAACPVAGLLLRLRGGDKAIPVRFAATQGVCLWTKEVVVQELGRVCVRCDFRHQK